MSDTTQTLLIALGGTLLVAVLVPVLFMTGMMASLVLFVLIAGVVLIAVGMRRR